MSLEHEMVLSAAALRRRREALPELLGAVRWRRRRRRAVRAGLCLVLTLVASSPWWSQATGWRQANGSGDEVAVANAPSWTVFTDDASVLARCEVPTHVDPSWFVDDDELQRLLRDDHRPDGLVRTGPRVLVAAAAIDPWPGELP